MVLGIEPKEYEDAIRSSSVWKELKAVRNVRPSFHTPLGLYGSLAYTGVFYFLFRGKEPWTFKHGGEIMMVKLCYVEFDQILCYSYRLVILTVIINELLGGYYLLHDYMPYRKFLNNFYWILLHDIFIHCFFKM